MQLKLMITETTVWRVYLWTRHSHDLR